VTKERCKNRKKLKHTKLKLSDVLYRFYTWSLTLRNEYRLRVFENRVLRRIFGSKSETMARD
jgi:hypothetical protein